MNLLPYEKFCITTSFNPAEVQEQLRLEIGPEQGFSLKKTVPQPGGKFFTGIAVNGTFEFKRVIGYRNSFSPVLKGYTESRLNGSQVYVSMRLHPAVSLFMRIWFGGVTIAGIAVLISSVAKSQFSPTLFIPIGLFLFGYALVMSGYNYERNMAKDKLLEILSGQVDDTDVR